MSAGGSRYQFTIWGLLAATTVLAVMLAMPGGVDLFRFVLTPLVVATVVMGAMLLAQLPLYWVIRPQDDPERDSNTGTR